MRLRPLVPFLVVLVSGAALGLAYEPWAIQELAWLAPAGLWLSCYRARPRRALLLGFLFGLASFIVSLHWLIGMRHSQDTPLVVVLGAIALLASYCALYAMPAAAWTSWWFARFDGSDKLQNLRWMAGTSLIWTGAEYLRGILFTGFPWNPIAASQYKNLVMIQLCDIGGIYLLSALIIFFSAGLAAVSIRHTRSRQIRLGWHPEIIIPMLLLGIGIAYGARTLLHADETAGTPFKISCVQPNIAQYDKWDMEKMFEIRRALWRWSVAASDENQPDLLLWPETALPDRWNATNEIIVIESVMERTGVPLLLGSLAFTEEEFYADEFRNQAVLLTTNAPPVTAEKRHLVPFGEYVPLATIAPWIAKLTPIQFKCNPGKSNVVFRLKQADGIDIPFSNLICFEDVLPYLARGAVQDGARLLVNLTNDGWFDPWAESEQHMALGVFRSVEHRVPTIRCSNSGVTCTITPTGKISARIPRLEAGILHATVHVPRETYRPTIYTRYGDAFARICAVLGSLLFLLTLVRRRPPQATTRT